MQSNQQGPIQSQSHPNVSAEPQQQHTSFSQLRSPFNLKTTQNIGLNAQLLDQREDETALTLRRRR